MALEHQPDLIITDNNMPKMTGLAAVALIQEKLPGAKAILLAREEIPFPGPRLAKNDCQFFEKLRDLILAELEPLP